MNNDFFALAQKAKKPASSILSLEQRLALAEKKIERERQSRKQAEQLLELKSLELSEANTKLRRAAATLEDEVAQRTSELASALEEARLAASSNRHLVDMVSHEIRTPLNALCGLLRMIGKDGTIEEGDIESQKQYFDLAAENAQQLADLLDSLLDISRHDERGHQSQSEVFALPDFLQGLFNRYSFLAAEKGLEFRLDQAPGFSLKAELLRLEQICGNLITNAIKYTNTGFVKVGLSLRPAKNPEQPAWLEISVGDTGVGLSQEQIDLMFKRFEQIPDQKLQSQKGQARRSSSGLGMYITKRLIALMDGSIDVQSALNYGTKILVSVPIQAASLTEIAVETPPAKPLEQSTAKTNITASALIVEDSRANRLLMSKQLEALGYETIEADSQRNGLTAIQQSQPFELALFDLNLDDGSSVPLAKALKRKNPDAKCILVTGDHKAVERSETDQGWPFDSALLKPFKPAQLRKLLQGKSA